MKNKETLTRILALFSVSDGKHSDIDRSISVTGPQTMVGEAMSSFSTWADPNSLHQDREKPEVAAPGSNINSTTNSSPWTGPVGSGTSYAAPMVTGMSALLRHSALKIWPEIVKPIVMATAIHKIEGNTRLSENDGAGGVVADLADNVARRVSGHLGGNWGGRNYSCSTPTTLNVATMSLQAGARTRAVVAWDTDPNYSAYNLQPGADLDIRVYGPNGYVTGSYSWDNTSEIVDFTPSTSGNYTLQVHKYRCSYNPQWLGWAWFQDMP